jgi:hypothetical protein
LDYCCWWASHGAAGLNFHTGDIVSGPIPCQYAVFVTSGQGYTTRPLGYGMKAFDLAGHGRWLPVTAGNQPGLSAWAALGEDQVVSIIIVNKQHDAASRPLKLALHFDAKSALADAKLVLLSAPGNDIAGTTGITLGGSGIEPDGTWKGQWTPSDISAGVIHLEMPPASAAVVRATLR